MNKLTHAQTQTHNKNTTDLPAVFLCLCLVPKPTKSFIKTQDHFIIISTAFDLRLKKKKKPGQPLRWNHSVCFFFLFVLLNPVNWDKICCRPPATHSSAHLFSATWTHLATSDGRERRCPITGFSRIIRRRSEMEPTESRKQFALFAI